MNELYTNSEKSPRSRRRWIYLIAAMIVLACFLALGKLQTVRLSLIVAQDNPAEMVLQIPSDCKLQNVYLRGTDNVPAAGRLFTLEINGREYEITDFSKMPAVDVSNEAGFSSRALPLDLKELQTCSQITVSCLQVDSAVQRYDLEVVFEVCGEPETVKNWNRFVQLHERVSGEKKQLSEK